LPQCINRFILPIFLFYIGITLLGLLIGLTIGLLISAILISSIIDFFIGLSISIIINSIILIVINKTCYKCHHHCCNSLNR